MAAPDLPMHAAPKGAAAHPGLGFREFVALVAFLMSLTALSIDIMLPALPALAAALDVAEGNQRQQVFVVFLVAMGAAQIVYGPLSDRYGRRLPLLAGLVLFTVASLLTVFAESFTQVLIGRALQGLGAAAVRVIPMGLVRDCYAGRDMGRVMSLAMMVFMAVPICAPAIGQAVLYLGLSWRAVFGVLLVGGALMLAWVVWRLPETHPPEKRRPLNAAALSGAFLEVMRHRLVLGYILGMSAIFGTLFAFITSASQVFTETFKLGGEFTLLFALVVLGLVVATYLNSRLIPRIGMRRLSHGALVVYVANAVLHLILIQLFGESLIHFLVFQAIIVTCFGFMGPNFNAIAMEPMGHIAGMAASLIGVITTVIGALLGFLVAQSYDGTTTPLTVGYICYGAAGLIFLAWAERGRLFQPAPGR